jgi:hypothetical protein
MPLVESPHINILDDRLDRRQRLAREKRRPHQREGVIPIHRSHTNAGTNETAIGIESDPVARQIVRETGHNPTLSGPLKNIPAEHMGLRDGLA